MRVVHGTGAADAHDAGFRCGLVTGVAAADAHDAGFRCGLAMRQGQLMLMMLAFAAGWPRGRGS